MTALLFQIAADSPGPRGDNPDDIGGILIIVGIIAVVALLAFTGLVLARRYGARATRPKGPHPPGRVGRS